MSRKDYQIIKRGKVLAGALALSAALVLWPTATQAAGSVSVAAQKTSAGVSEQVTVSV